MHELNSPGEESDQSFDGHFSQPERKSGTSGDRIKIAIVEDERLVAENLKETLEENDYQVVALAASGKDAIQKIMNTNPDVILMDIRLQGDIDGIETAIILQSNWKQRFRIIFLTAHSQKQFPHISGVHPTFVYITKPYSQHQLLSAIETVLKQSL